LKSTILIALTLTASVAVGSSAYGSGPDSADAFQFRGAEFRILSADGKQTIGTTRFTSSRGESTIEIKGETNYVDGERDSEVERLQIGDARVAPRLDTYQHSFFNADGSIAMVDTLDATSGVASCDKYALGTVKRHTSTLKVPADAFAGASGLMMIVGMLRLGEREIHFHEFACAPGPEIFSVAASTSEKAERWPLYPGNLTRLDMRPDLGALSVLIAPFLPKVDAWFSRDDDWNYVGGEFDRYFRGPHVLTVRVASPD
jgi:hypothetical protein